MNDAITLLSGADALPEIGFGTCAGTSDAVHGFGTLDNFANNLLALETKPTTFGKAPSENRSTYMQVLELARPIRGENVTPPGQSGYIKHLGMGEADAHMGDQAALFRTFTYKPMLLTSKGGVTRGAETPPVPLPGSGRRASRC
jgi:hypothetical protein